MEVRPLAERTGLRLGGHGDNVASPGARDSSPRPRWKLPGAPGPCNDLARVLYLLAVDPPELAGGRWAAPGWLIVVVAAVTAAFAVVYLYLRFRGSERDKR